MTQSNSDKHRDMVVAIIVLAIIHLLFSGYKLSAHHLPQHAMVKGMLTDNVSWGISVAVCLLIVIFAFMANKKDDDDDDDSST